MKTSNSNPISEFLFINPYFKKDTNELNLLLVDRNYNELLLTLIKANNITIHNFHHEVNEGSLIFSILINNEYFLFFKLSIKNIAPKNDFIDYTISPQISVNKLCTNFIFHKLNFRKLNTSFSNKIKLLKTVNSNEYIFCFLIPNFITFIKVNLEKELVSVKNYKYLGFVITKCLFLSTEEDFTGANYEIICSVNYDKNEKNLVNFHKIYLPSLENEIILDHQCLAVKVINNKTQKFSRINADFFYFFYITDKANLIIFDKIFSIRSQFTFSHDDEDHFKSVDYFKLLKMENHFYVFLLINNFIIEIYKLDEQLKNYKLSNTIKLGESSDSCFGILKFVKVVFSKGLFFLHLDNHQIFIKEINLTKNSINQIKKIVNELDKFNDSISLCEEKSKELYNVTLYDKFGNILHEDLNEIKIQNLKQIHCELKINQINFDENLELELKEFKEVLDVLFQYNISILISNDNKICIYDYQSKKTIKEIKENLIRTFIDNSDMLLIFFDHSFLFFEKQGKLISESNYKNQHFLVSVLENKKENRIYLIFKDDILVSNNSCKELTEISDCDEVKFDLFNELNSEKKFTFYENLFIFFKANFGNAGAGAGGGDKNNPIVFEFSNNKISKFGLDLKNTFYGIYESNEVSIKQFILTQHYLFITTKSGLIYINQYKLDHNSKNLQCELINIIDISSLYSNHKFTIIENKEEIKIILTQNRNIISFILNFSLKANNIKLLYHPPDDKIYKLMRNNKNLFYAIMSNNNKINIYNLNKLNAEIENSVFKSYYNKNVESIKISKNGYMGINLRSCLDLSINKVYLFHLFNLNESVNPVLEINLEADLIDYCIAGDYKSKNKGESNNIILFLALKDEIEKKLLILKIGSSLSSSRDLQKIIQITNTEIDTSINLKEINPEKSKYEITYKKIEQVNNKFLLTNIQTLSELKILLLFSNYGQLKFYDYDEFCNLQEFYEFNFSSHLIEISNIKNNYENREDLIKIFEEDSELKFLETYVFYDCLIFTKNKEKSNNILLINFEEKYIILLLNFGLLIFRLKKDLYTGYKQIKFYQQLSFNKVKERERSLKIKLVNEIIYVKSDDGECSKIKCQNNKFNFV